MVDHGRLVLSSALLTCLIVSSGRAAGYRRGPLAYPQIQAAVRPIHTITSKWTRDLVITMTSADARLTGGDNEFCILFERRDTREPVEVENVRVDFALLVGRIQEKPIKTHLVREQQGHYCGRADLGKQYFIPANYYAFLLYADSSGKRKERIFLTVRLCVATRINRAARAYIMTRTLPLPGNLANACFCAHVAIRVMFPLAGET
jgi:hypothetical protein